MPSNSRIIEFSLAGVNGFFGSEKKLFEKIGSGLTKKAYDPNDKIRLFSLTGAQVLAALLSQRTQERQLIFRR